MAETVTGPQPNYELARIQNEFDLVDATVVGAGAAGLGVGIPLAIAYEVHEAPEQLNTPNAEVATTKITAVTEQRGVNSPATPDTGEEALLIWAGTGAVFALAALSARYIQYRRLRHQPNPPKLVVMSHEI